jgi:[ribosomal protein S5]-alanine N-acetyltransferase
MNIKTERLTLRPWVLGDLDSLVQYANNRKVTFQLRDRFPYPYTAEHGAQWIRMANQNFPTTNFAIEVDQHAVGGIGFIQGEDVFRCTAELGYWLGEPYWGRGLMTEAVQLVTRYAFETFEYYRIFAYVRETNPGSARVLEKAGYSFESRMRKSVIKEGNVWDCLVYVKIRE